MMQRFWPCNVDDTKLLWRLCSQSVARYLCSHSAVLLSMVKVCSQHGFLRVSH